MNYIIDNKFKSSNIDDLKERFNKILGTTIFKIDNISNALKNKEL